MKNSPSISLINLLLFMESYLKGLLSLVEQLGLQLKEKTKAAQAEIRKLKNLPKKPKLTLNFNERIEYLQKKLINRRVMKKYFLSLVIFLSAWSVQAHQTEISSTMLVEQDNNTWVLQIRSALTAFDQVIKVNYPPYESAEEFQALVLEHIKNNLQITFNEEDKVTLQNGMVKLGHETSVVFEVVGAPENIASVYVKNSSFKTIHRNQSALIILKKGFKKKQFTLNKKNDYGLHLQAANNQFIPATDTVATTTVNSEMNTKYTYTGLIFGLLGIFSLAFLWIRRSRVNI